MCEIITINKKHQEPIASKLFSTEAEHKFVENISECYKMFRPLHVKKRCKRIHLSKKKKKNLMQGTQLRLHFM